MTETVRPRESGVTIRAAKLEKEYQPVEENIGKAFKSAIPEFDKLKETLNPEVERRPATR